jgi:hypothetical protein
VQVIGIVKDERCFSTLTFMKNKLRNWLTMHLELVIRMFSQKFFTMENLPFATTIQSWKDNNFGIRNDGGVIECYNCPLFSWSMLVWIWWFINFHPTPFWAFKNQEWELVFLHWVCMTKIFFCVG